MTENQDYIFVPKIDLNEILTTGSVTKGALFCSKNNFYVIPFNSVNVWNQSDSNFTNAKDFIVEVNKQLPTLNNTEFEDYMAKVLSPDRIYNVSALEKFSMQVGFFIFGGARMKRVGEGVQVMNIQPKSVRLAIKNFYGLA